MSEWERERERERENSCPIDENKNGKNEDEFQKSTYIKWRTRKDVKEEMKREEEKERKNKFWAFYVLFEQDEKQNKIEM
jgi:phage terminase Nu1 subunit (DNA packaging protein)